MKLRCIVVVILCGFLAGCVSTAGTGSETVLSKGSKYAVSDNSFTYRQLRVEDFQAEALDRSSGNTIHFVQARSCISIRTAADTRIRSTGNGGSEAYVGTLSNVSFQAVFEPYCSWWNHSMSRKRVPYVLEHEQIHFALTELSARELNRKMRHEPVNKTVYGKTAREVEEKIRKKVRGKSRLAINQSGNDHRAFDEQTSFVYRPDRQEEWLEDVNRRLAETEDYRRGA